MMRKVLLCAVLASTFIAAPASARDGAAYVGIDAGVMLPKGVDLDVGGTEDAERLTTNTGWDGAVIVGFDFGAFKVEAEASKKSTKTQQLVASGSFDVDPVSAGTQNLANVDGKLKVDNYMVNAMYDFGSNEGVGLYVGAGAGFGKAEYNSKIFGVATPLLADSDKGFAWQLMAGASVPITEGLELGVKYKYFTMSGLDFQSPIAGKVSSSFASHGLLTTLRVNF